MVVAQREVSGSRQVPHLNGTRACVIGSVAKLPRAVPSPATSRPVGKQRAGMVGARRDSDHVQVTHVLLAIDLGVFQHTVGVVVDTRFDSYPPRARILRPQTPGSRGRAPAPHDTRTSC